MNTTIGVVGLGYVGLPLAIHAATRGFQVIGFDIDEVKVAQLHGRDASFLSDDERSEFKEAKTLEVTHNELDIAGLDAYIVCVPTPVTAQHLPDLKPLESASAIVGRTMERGSLVVIESTVNPGACEEVVLPILERESGLHAGEFFFAHCPERVNPGDERWNVRSIPRVLGAYDQASLERALALYRTLVGADVYPMGSIKEAEAVKMVENSFRDINIAFVNELAMAFDKAGIDVLNVIKGASTKPFGFLPHYPGAGVGGHCIPVDPYYLIRFGRSNGFEHRFLKIARHINDAMPGYTVKLLTDLLKQRHKHLKGARIALLGLSYKRGIPDTRESPALKILDELERRGADVKTFDPHVRRASSEKNLDAALRDRDAVVLATDHEEFCSLSPQDFERHGIHIVVDGRNCLDKDAFLDTEILYKGIGH